MSPTGTPLPAERRRRGTAVRRVAMLVLLLGVAPLAAAAAAAPAQELPPAETDGSLAVTIEPTTPTAGEPFVVVVRGAAASASVQCFIEGRPLTTVATGPAPPVDLRLDTTLPPDLTAGDATLVVTSQGADGVVRSARRSLTVRPRDPWLEEEASGIAVLAGALVVLAVGTAVIVGVHQRRRSRVTSDATAPE